MVPDVIVEHDGNDWKIHLNNDYIPRLRISSTYRDMIARGTLSKGERDYLKDRIRSGKFLIDSIEQRQRTIERITREILKAQMPFFENGVSQLKPLTMTQIADVVGVHETTVSRAIANKYIRTPTGFRVQVLLHTGLPERQRRLGLEHEREGDDRDLVAGEDKAGPFSDQELVEQAPGKGDQHRPAYGRQVPRGARHLAEQPAARLQVAGPAAGSTAAGYADLSREPPAVGASAHAAKAIMAALSPVCPALRRESGPRPPRPRRHRGP